MAARKTKLAVDWIVTTTGHGSEAVVLNFRTARPNIKKALVVKNFRTSEAGADPTGVRISRISQQCMCRKYFT